MAEKNGPATAGRVPTADRPTRIRNVAVVGPSGTGKTTLTEALLFHAGATTRQGRVEDGTTVSDFDDVETRQGRSVNLTLSPFQWGDIKINLLDTPGYADFLGDQRAGIRGADAVLFLVSAVDGVNARSRLTWDECAAVEVPRAIVITKCDHPRADFPGVVAQCQEAFGADSLPAFVPVRSGTGDATALTGILTLLSQRYYDYSSGIRRDATPPEDLTLEMEGERAALIEGIIQESEDEALMERYLSGEAIDAASLADDLRAAVARGGFHPIVPVSATTGIGVLELLDEIPTAFPSPVERSARTATDATGRERAVPCDPDGPLVAQVLKTINDHYVGRISLVRVLSGRLAADATVRVSHARVDTDPQRLADSDERVGAVSAPLGKQSRSAGEVMAGDICAVAKLSQAETGDTLSAPQTPLRLEAWSFPEPLLPTALRARSKADEDKLAQAVAKLSEEDTTLRVEVNAETHQMVLWCLGEAHLDLVMDRLANRHGVAVLNEPVRVPLRETFTVPAQGQGRNVKQTGGHGEYGVCNIEVEPLPSGSGLQFVDKIVGGVVPRQFIPSVEKGVRNQMEQGVVGGYPVVDIKVTLYDGKAHSVDSSDRAFQRAGKLALKDAAERSTLTMLEPIDTVSVLVNDEYVGAVMSDLSARRGRVLGSEPAGNGRTVIRAEVPELEITRYAIDLRSVSHGTGTFTRSYLRYEPLPPQLAQKHHDADDAP